MQPLDGGRSLALLLADGRFPAGGHAHSGGVEAAVTAGRIRDLADLRRFVVGRLASSGRVAAALAAAACACPGAWERLDIEADARMVSPALRATSRRQGRLLLRAATAILPRLETGAQSPHHGVAMGLVAAAAGLGPTEAARWAAYESVTAPASAGLRLLGLDPFGVHAMVAELMDTVDAEARRAGDGDELACPSAPLLDIGAEHHASEGVRLFAS